MFLLSIISFLCILSDYLLTRCQVPVPCFCCFCISEKSQQEISSDCPQNLRRFFMQRKTSEDQRAAWGATQGLGRPPATGPPMGAGGTRPCPLGTSSAPSDAYKITLNLKTSGAAIIFHRRHPDVPSPQTLFRGSI